MATCNPWRPLKVRPGREAGGPPKGPPAVGHRLLTTKFAPEDILKHVYQETCPRPTRRIRTLRRRQLALGQTITGHLTHRAPTESLLNTQPPLMAPLAGQTLLTFRTRTLHAYPRVRQYRTSPRQWHRTPTFDREGRWRISFQMVRRGPCKNVNRIHTLPLLS